MYSRRPQVREAFAEELFTRLKSQDMGETNMTIQKKAFRLKWQYILIALVIAVAMIFGLSPKARALAGTFFQEIAGFSVEEQPENPMSEYFDEDGVLDAPNATVYVVPTTTVDGLLSDPPFEFSLPEYIPEGYEIRSDYVAIANSKTWINIIYQGDSSNKEIVFMAETSTPTLSVGVDAAEEITINGQTAMLVRGNWALDNTWDFERGITLYWTVDETNYRLIIHRIDPEQLDDLLPELIKMAESVH